MIGFWISAGAMILMIALLLIQAMRHALAMPDVVSSSPDLAVYRDQLADVDRDLGRELLGQAEAGRLRLEVQRRMLEVDRQSQAPTTALAGWSVGFAVIALLVSLAAGVMLYTRLGVPGYPDLPLAARFAMADEAYQTRPSQDEAEAAQPAFVTPADVDPELATLLDQLRAVVATRPDDLIGHGLLVQNEAAIGNFAAARQAQDAVVRLKGAEVTGEDLSDLAQLMIAAAGGTVTPEAEAVLIRCLQVDPRNGWARYYSGLMFAQIGRPDRAFSLWEPLLREGPGTAPWVGPISSLIESVADAAGVAYAAPPAGPDAAGVAAAEDMSEADRQAMIATMVDGLEARLSDDGGPVGDWVRLITSLGVLAEVDRAAAAYQRAGAVFAGMPGELAALKAAAVQAGVAE